jgi:hypothetical protein
VALHSPRFPNRDVVSQSNPPPSRATYCQETCENRLQIAIGNWLPPRGGLARRIWMVRQSYRQMARPCGHLQAAAAVWLLDAGFICSSFCLAAQWKKDERLKRRSSQNWDQLDLSHAAGQFRCMLPRMLVP